VSLIRDLIPEVGAASDQNTNIATLASMVDNAGTSISSLSQPNKAAIAGQLINTGTKISSVDSFGAVLGLLDKIVKVGDVVAEVCTYPTKRLQI
jgi:hypothetical protein